MRAIVLEGPSRAVLREVPPPELAPGEILVVVDYAGICGSDLAVFRGSRRADYPLVMGHEAVGRIVDPGQSEHAPGTRVVIEPNIPCGRCSVCQRGHGNVCPAKRSLGMNWPGVFADMVAVDAEFAHPLPTDISCENAVGIEPLAVALHAYAAGQVSQDDTVAVIGCGAEGLLLVQVAVAFGARVIAVDLREDRLAVAQRLGAERAIHLAPDRAGSNVLELRAQVVFEAAGAAQALRLALQAVAPGGRVVALGLSPGPVEMAPLDFVRRGLTLVGSLIYDHPADFQSAMDVIRRGSIQPSRLVSDVVEGLEALPAALDSLSAGDPGGKTVVKVAASRTEQTL